MFFFLTFFRFDFFFRMDGCTPPLLKVFESVAFGSPEETVKESAMECKRLLENLQFVCDLAACVAPCEFRRWDTDGEATAPRCLAKLCRLLSKPAEHCSEEPRMWQCSNSEKKLVSTTFDALYDAKSLCSRRPKEAKELFHACVATLATILLLAQPCVIAELLTSVLKSETALVVSRSPIRMLWRCRLWPFGWCYSALYNALQFAVGSAWHSSRSRSCAELEVIMSAESWPLHTNTEQARASQKVFMLKDALVRLCTAAANFGADVTTLGVKFHSLSVVQRAIIAFIDFQAGLEDAATTLEILSGCLENGLDAYRVLKQYPAFQAAVVRLCAAAVDSREAMHNVARQFCVGSELPYMCMAHLPEELENILDIGVTKANPFQAAFRCNERGAVEFDSDAAVLALQLGASTHALRKCASEHGSIWLARAKRLIERLVRKRFFVTFCFMGFFEQLVFCCEMQNPSTAKPNVTRFDVITAVLCAQSSMPHSSKRLRTSAVLLWLSQMTQTTGSLRLASPHAAVVAMFVEA